MASVRYYSIGRVLYMQLYIYIYIYMYIYICIHVYIFFSYIDMYICMYLCMYLCMYIRVYKYMFTTVHYVCLHWCVHIGDPSVYAPVIYVHSSAVCLPPFIFFHFIFSLNSFEGSMVTGVHMFIPHSSPHS